MTPYLQNAIKPADQNMWTEQFTQPFHTPHVASARDVVYAKSDPSHWPQLQTDNIADELQSKYIETSSQNYIR